MATSVGLNFRLTAAVDKFEASMKDVEKRLGGIEKASKQTASGMKLLAAVEVGKLLVGGLTAVYNTIKSGLGTITSFVSSIRESIDKVGKLAESLGMNEVALQIFLKTAGLSGMSADQFSSAVLAMNKRLGEFYSGTGPAKQALESLGFSMEDLKGKTPDQQLKMIAQAIMLLPTKAQQAAAAFAIFGDAGKKMLPTLDAIANNVDKIATKGLALGQFLSTKQVNAIESMNDAFSDVWDTIKGIGAQVVANLAEPVEKMLQSFMQFVAEYKSFTTDATGGTGLANDITKAMFDAAVVLGDWADFLLDGLFRFYEFMKSLFERLFDFAADSLGVDRYASDEANRMDQERKANEALIQKYNNLESLLGLSVEQYNERTRLEQRNVELQKSINAEEDRYYREKQKTTTGMISIGDRMRAFRDNFLNMGGGGPQGNPLATGGGGSGGIPWGPPDGSGLWTWNPTTYRWEYGGGPGQFGPDSENGIDPTDTEQDTTDEDLLSENKSHTAILNRIDANTSGFILQPVVIG